MMNMPPIIQTRSLAKTYVVGRVRVAALEDVTLSVGEGRFVAISGASGSGKSTLLNLLGGAAGCVLGWAVSLVINRVVNFYMARQGGMPFISYFAFPFWLFLGAIGFSLLISLVSGIYPARRAARVDPVVALRHD
jgi:ABC-type Fe3+/spermidine/putrescine transport system ATPase subunit